MQPNKVMNTEKKKKKHRKKADYGTYVTLPSTAKETKAGGNRTVP